MSGRAPETEAEIFQRAERSSRKRLEEDPGRSFVAARPLREHGIGAVARSGEVAAFVVNRFSKHGARDLRANVTEWKQVGSYGALGEGEITILAEGFQANRFFELADAELGEGHGLQFQIGFLDLRIVLTEIRHEAEVHLVEESAFDYGADPAEQECIEILPARVGPEQAVVSLRVSMNLQVRAAVAVGEPKTIAAEGDWSGVMRRRCSRLDRCGGATVRQGRLSGNRDLFRGGERLAGSGIGLGKAGHCECGEHQISEGHMLAVHERSYVLKFFVAVSACGETATFTISSITLLAIRSNKTAFLAP